MLASAPTDRVIILSLFFAKECAAMSIQNELLTAIAAPRKADYVLHV